MKISISILAVIFSSSLFISCKETNNKPTEDTALNKTEKKEIAVAVKPETATFHIEGMTCAIGCAKTIEEKLTEMNGVQNAKVDFDKKEAIVNFDATILSPEKITKAVEACADGETYKVSEMKSKS